MADINKVVLVGRLTRDAEQSYTRNGFALLKFAVAVNRRRKQGDQWIDEANFFDATVFGRQGEAIASFMKKGKQVAIEGQLHQERWEAQDGSKRSKVSIDVNNIQLLGSGRRDDFTSESDYQPHADKEPLPAQSSGASIGFPETNFEDDIPF